MPRAGGAGLDPPGRIQGTVKAGKAGLAGARVRILQEGILLDTQVSGAEGRYSSRLLFTGDYVVEIAAEGYRPQTRTVRVELDRTTHLDFTLDPS